jgi:hypothetical protein
VEEERLRKEGERMQQEKTKEEERIPYIVIQQYA